MRRPYSQAQFLCSTPQVGSAPPDAGWEAAFAGRSNAGKSSALNAITNRRALARASKTPGRTQHLVFFTLDPHRRLVDLPGYGYAQVDGPTRARLDRALQGYLQQRRSLRGLLVMMDIRHPLTAADGTLLDWCASSALPVHVLLTKADKLGRGRALTTLRTTAGALAERSGPCTVQLFSAVRRQGIDEVLAVLDAWLGLPDTAAK